MVTAADDSDSTLPPDDAFAVLGNETRMEILQTLGQADGPVPFTELRERVGVRHSGQFNYHLGKLTGHFIQETDDGYGLRRAGTRVIESVLSGAVTETPVIEPTPVDAPCHLCGGTVEVAYREERMETYCTECAGLFGEGNRTGEWIGDASHGYLGYLPMPPAGTRGRTPDEALQAAWVWGNLEILSLASGVCPRCSGTIDYDFEVCEDHDASEGLCTECDRLKAINIGMTCTNCVFDGGGEFTLRLASDTHLLAFQTGHGLNPVNPESITAVNRVHTTFEEEIHSTDPFEASLIYSINGDPIMFTVDGDLDVIEVSKGEAAQSS